MIGQTQHDGFESENLETNDLGAATGATTGASTSAVSRLFGDGAFGDPNKKRLIILGGGVGVVLIVAAALYFTMEQESPEMPMPPAQENIASEGSEPPVVGQEDEQGEVVAETDDEIAGEIGLDEVGDEMASTGTGDIQVMSPADGQSRDYDETTGGALFQWEGGADYIVFSRYSSMTPITRKVRVTGSNSYSLRDAYPGRWYWRLENEDQSSYSEVQSFSIAPPSPRAISLSEPTAGASISGDSLVSWNGDNKVSYYRVELSDGNFATPNYRFSTTGTSMQMSGVMSGSYQLRVGGFSEVSGRWEYSQPISVTVQ